MTLLTDIPTFPQSLSEMLQSQFGITSAEAFYDHTVKNPAGMSSATKVTKAELNRLAGTIEGYLAPAFVASCRRPVQKHGRGVIVDSPRP